MLKLSISQDIESTILDIFYNIEKLECAFILMRLRRCAEGIPFGQNIAVVHYSFNFNA